MRFSMQNQPGQAVGWKPYFSNPSVGTLLVSNLLIIIWALIQMWPVYAIMWVYWAQSVGIGIVWFIKLVSLKDFSTKGFKLNGRPVAPDLATKVKVCIFFLLHYGFFHLLYALFLAKGSESIAILPIVIGGIIFLVDQFFSFFYNAKRESSQKPNIGKLMFFPYARILPMHLTVIGIVVMEDYGFHFTDRLALLVFFLLKTAADVVMYVMQLRGFTDKAAFAPAA
jgi:hypothetical protein